MNGSRSAYTRKRILEAALRLFAQKGDKTSLREITAEAQVNVSAVNYHFGSKEGLIQAIYQHRVEALNQTLLRALEALEEQCNSPDGPEIRQLVEAYFRPLLLHALADAPKVQGAAPPPRDPEVLLRTLTLYGHARVLDRFRVAFGRALPHLPEHELLWRLVFMLGAASCAVSCKDSLLFALDPRHSEPFSADSLIDRLLAFLVGGCLAPLPVRADTAPLINTGVRIRPGLAGS